MSVTESMVHFESIAYESWQYCVHTENWDFGGKGNNLVSISSDTQMLTYWQQGTLHKNQHFPSVRVCFLPSTKFPSLHKPPRTHWRNIYKLNWLGQSFKELVLNEQKCSHFYGILRYTVWMPLRETFTGNTF